MDESAYQHHLDRIVAEHNYCGSAQHSNSKVPLQAGRTLPSWLQSFSGLPSKPPAASTPSVAAEEDKVLAYARAVLTDGLVLKEFCDAIHEGDGNRLERCYKFLTAYFFNTGHNKYAIECFRYMCAVKIQDVSTPEQAAQVKWSRFVNTRGKKGCNIPTDLHMEHLNRVVKRLGSKWDHYWAWEQMSPLTSLFVPANVSITWAM